MQIYLSVLMSVCQHVFPEITVAYLIESWRNLTSWCSRALQPQELEFLLLSMAQAASALEIECAAVATSGNDRQEFYSIRQRATKRMGVLSDYIERYDDCWWIYPILTYLLLVMVLIYLPLSLAVLMLAWFAAPKKMLLVFGTLFWLAMCLHDLSA